MNHQGRGRPQLRGRGRNRRSRGRGRGRGRRNHWGQEQVSAEGMTANMRASPWTANGSQPYRRRHETHPLNYKRLEDLAERDPHDALHKLASCKKQLVELLKEPHIRFDLMIQLTRALANIFECSSTSETLLDIIGTLHTEGFMNRHLTTYIRDWSRIILYNHSYQNIVPQLLLPVVIILFSLLFPSSCSDVDKILSHLETAVCKCEEKGIVFPDESFCELDNLNDYQMQIQEHKHGRQHGTTRRDFSGNHVDGLPPTDNFRLYPIFPMIHELKENYRPILRVNIVNGGYDNVDHYLDVQFRLLREDLVKPLRNGISEYRSTLQVTQGKKLVKLKDIYVYHHVQVLEAKPDREGISYLTRFNVDRLKKIDWVKSKRLIYGSLVCLSSDHFETVIFAVVTNRQARDLKKGLIELKVQGMRDILSTLFSETFTMVESPAYFEAYRHVLKRLQDTNENNFPLERYIVEAVPNVSLPLYVRQNRFAKYDLKAVSRHQRALKAYVTISWPPLANFDLDTSQYDAFKAALTEELCLIQGPPGTGKTFIGLKIVETLLYNIDVWSPDDDPSPILLICFTNHALDQFLEGVLSFLPNEGIIRIGGRSSSEKLKTFNLNEIRRQRSRPKYRRLHVKTIRDEMIKVAKRIQATQKATRVTRSKILHEEELKNVMTYGQYRKLMTGYLTEYRQTPKPGEYFTYWLQAVVDEEETLHEDVAPPLDLKASNRFAVHTGRKSEYVLKGRQLNDYVKQNLTLAGDSMSGEIMKTTNMWSLSLTDRWRLYRHWLKNHQENLQRLFRVANSALLKENVLRPFMTKGHWEYLRSGRNSRNVRVGQLLSSYLGVVTGRLDELIRNLGTVVKVPEITDEQRADITLPESMNSHEGACAIAVGQPLLQVYIAKALVQFDTMSKQEAQSVHDVYQLSYHNRWRLYKHWLSLYNKQLRERMIASQNYILREDSLRPQMTSGQHVSLNDPSKDDNIQKVDDGQLLILWLQAYSGVPLTNVQEVICKLPQESERIDIKGAAELLAEARYVEDDDDETFIDELEDIIKEYSTDDEEDDEMGAAGATSDRHDEGWNTAGQDARSVRRYLIKNLRKSDRLAKERAVRVTNVWELQLCDRWNLYRYWVHLYNENLQNSLLPLHEEYERQVRLLKEVREQEDVEIVREAKIIALTTTGAAKYHNLVERVHPKIVIVEEAAEVLEAHIVTSLTEKCQHLILIGDHQQLRPNPTVYELSTRYGLDISLFERLIKNRFPRHRLNLQHRMRPEISQLLKIHDDFYPGLKDHKSVLRYDDVQGVLNNIFFLDHTVQESRQHDDHSRSNRFEAEFLTSLCRYLLQQDYKPEQITILTAYAGQLWNFKSLMPKSIFKDVRVCPVDSYQGEENDIILLSLVRSNEVGSIGFLKTANRVCVALSRAKKGLYCVGNFSLLSSENDLWKVISSTLREKGSLGNSMKLVCANHPYVVTEVRVAQDFEAVPEGGCSRPCKAQMNCGHECALSCHPRDAEHTNIKCSKRCLRPICDLNHKCGRLCFEKCESLCKRMIYKHLVCGHSKLVMCFQHNSTEIQCQEICPLMLNCGHRCKNKCGEDCTVSCRVTVKQKLPCGHEILTACGNKENECSISCNEILRCGHRCRGTCGGCSTVSCRVTVKQKLPCGHEILTACGNKEIECSISCNEILRCGHRCRGTCGGCKRGKLHVECVQPCMRKLICGHACTSVCSTYCPPCEKKCENLCIHSKCRKKCGEVCTPCQETCELACAHKICRQPCSVPCVGQPCNKPCRRIIKCGHKCIGLCGDMCPVKCYICDKIELPETVPGKKDDDPARFVQLEDCGHVIQVNILDEWMTPTTNESYSVVQVKMCPNCKTHIRRSRRYRHVIKQAQIDVEYVKEQINGNFEAIEKKRKEISQKIAYAETAAEAIVPELFNFFLGRRGGQIKPKEFSNSAGVLLYNIHNQVNDVSVSTAQITSLEYKLAMFKKLCSFKRKANNISDKNGNDLNKRFIKHTFFDVLQWVDSLSYVNSQNEDDWNCEVKRISAVLMLMEARVCVSAINNPPVEELMKKINAIVTDGCKYSFVKQIDVRLLFLELARYDSSLKSFEDGTRMVVNGVGWASGHWLKCQKGHIYSTGETTCTWDKRKCPECEHGISNQEYHRLDSIGRLTTAMTRCKIVANKLQ